FGFHRRSVHLVSARRDRLPDDEQQQKEDRCLVLCWFDRNAGGGGRQPSKRSGGRRGKNCVRRVEHRTALRHWLAILWRSTTSRPTNRYYGTRPPRNVLGRIRAPASGRGRKHTFYRRPPRGAAARR